jgi:hypothetical protein
MGARTLNPPRPARVRWDLPDRGSQPTRGYPAEVDGEAIESLRESWLVEDRWWTSAPLRRRYWELAGRRGRNVVVFHDLCSNRWFSQSP